MFSRLAYILFLLVLLLPTSKSFKGSTLQHAEDFVKTEQGWNDLEAHLNGILEGKKRGAYIGGTLSIPFKGIHLFFNFNHSNPWKISVLLAKIYIAHKTEKHHHWELAKSILKADDFRLA